MTSLTRWLHPWRMTTALWWKTVTDTAVYRLAAHLSPQFVAFYMVVTYAVLAGLATAVFRWQDVPKVAAASQQAWDELKQTWPETLTFSYKNGALSNNLTESLTVEYPSSWAKIEGLPEKLAVVFPTRDESFDISNQAFFFLLPNELVMQAASGETQKISWEALFTNESFSLNKATLSDHDTLISELIGTLRTQLTVAYFFWSWWGVLAFRLILLLLYAFVAQTFFYLAQNRVKYWHAFKIGLFLLPITELLLIIWKTMRPDLSPALPFWWLWLVLIFVVAVTNRNGKLA